MSGALFNGLSFFAGLVSVEILVFLRVVLVLVFLITCDKR
jgi:hypothetical protein